jgi:asparagine synthase (glutamine-hydrolysing)
MSQSDTLPLARVEVVAAGAPRFTTQPFAEVSKRAGTETAWRECIAAHGVDAAKHVDGDFAIGVIEPNGEGWLAVDRFAVHSMCWRVIGGRLHVAERADDLAKLAPRSEVDPQAIFDYLYFHVIPSPRTIFRDVFRVPPGHRVTWRGSRLDIQPYWTPVFEEPRHADFASLAQQFRDTLRESVGRQLDGSKAACFLSGGTDSSTIAGMIGEATGSPASTFSIGFEAEGYDEMAYARIAANWFGTDHHEYYVTPADLVRSIPDVARHYDQPFGNSSALPAYYCARFARQTGVTRLLAGDGGDELFGGNARYAKQRIFGWYDQVPSFLAKGLLEPTLLHTPVGGAPLMRKGKSYIEQARVPLPDRMQMYNLLLRLGIRDVFEDSFLERVDVKGPLTHQQAVWNQSKGASPLNRMLAYDWRYTLAEADLPKVRGTTDLAQVSVGFPFLDPQMVAFSQALPSSYKLKGLKLRWFFKEALRGFLPDEILVKKKQGFGLPFGVWANRDADLRELATDSLRSLATRGWIRPAFIRELLDQRLAEHPGYYGEMVWILMMLEQWARGQADLE